VRLLDRIGASVLVADGAMGTQLQLAGLAIGGGGEGWNAAHPDRVLAIHAAYVAAGSDLILTNTFGASRFALDRYGLAGRRNELNAAAARLAREAAGAGRAVLGDVGPTGQLLEPLGPLTRDALRDDASARCRSLLDEGADGIILETLTAADEAAVAVEAALDAGAPCVIASFAFEKRRNGRVATMMGLSPREAGALARTSGASVVGANCGTHLAFSDFAALAGELAEASGLPVMLQPNAGQPRLLGGTAVYEMTAQAFAEGMRAVLAVRPAIVGGCCGTGPDHVRALRSVVDAGTIGGRPRSASGE
jgi:5-methyltetrahydrofolate--homocysteine methyltransferase